MKKMPGAGVRKQKAVKILVEVEKDLEHSLGEGDTGSRTTKFFPYKEET